jgi:hypothetical protein
LERQCGVSHVTSSARTRRTARSTRPVHIPWSMRSVFGRRTTSGRSGRVGDVRDGVITPYRRHKGLKKPSDPTALQSPSNSVRTFCATASSRPRRQAHGPNSSPASRSALDRRCAGGFASRSPTKSASRRSGTRAHPPRAPREIPWPDVRRPAGEPGRATPAEHGQLLEDQFYDRRPAGRLNAGRAGFFPFADRRRAEGRSRRAASQRWPQRPSRTAQGARC